jgi:predicted RNA binding protein YcfA (HicA-like mRNA interferase family)
MAKLPSLTARKVVRALKHAGFVGDRQKGSHLMLLNLQTKARTVVPVHPGHTIKEQLLTRYHSGCELIGGRVLEVALISDRAAHPRLGLSLPPKF